MRYLVLFLVFVTLSLARENPFIPSDINNSNLTSTNINTNAPSFDPKSVHFPSNTMELQKAVFFYKTLQGEIKQQTIDINSSFDPKSELRIEVIPPGSMSLQDALETLKIVPKVNQTMENPIKTFKFENNLLVELYNKKFQIITQDKLKQSYFIEQENKLVFDFEKNKADYGTKTIFADDKLIKKIIFGSHGSSYRIVFELNRASKYEVVKIENGIKVNLN
nr:AMIN domain-containing protein [Campylobacter sp.]